MDLQLITCAERSTAHRIVAAINFGLGIVSECQAAFSALTEGRFRVMTDAKAVREAGYTVADARMFALGVKVTLIERQAMDIAANQLAAGEDR